MAPTTLNESKLLNVTPSHSPEAERGINGSMLLDHRRCDDVMGAVRPDEFYSPAYRAVFETIIAIHNEGKIPDAPLVIERMRAEGVFEMHGGMAMLLDIAESVPTASNAVHFAGIIREHAIKREARHAGLTIAGMADDRGASALDVVAKAESTILAIGERRTESQVASISDKLTSTLNSLYERRQSGNVTAILTHIPDLNRRIGGWRNELHVVAARPRMGKSAFAVNVAKHAAERGYPVLVMSLEMSGEELCERMLAAEASINSAHIRDGELSDDDMRQILDATSGIADLPITFDETPCRTLFDICSQARRMKRQGKLALLVIDHLGLIVPENVKEPRHEQVGRITRRLKILARELQVPILLLAQLNRDVEKDRDHRPKLSSLRESGSIEQDAGVVLFIHREEEYQPDDLDLRGKAELIVAKARAGAAGIIKLTWLCETQEFVPAAHGEPWKGLD